VSSGTAAERDVEKQNMMNDFINQSELAGAAAVAAI
jgi:hypothetical protein